MYRNKYFNLKVVIDHDVISSSRYYHKGLKELVHQQSGLRAFDHQVNNYNYNPVVEAAEEPVSLSWLKTKIKLEACTKCAGYSNCFEECLATFINNQEVHPELKGLGCFLIFDSFPNKELLIPGFA